MPDIAQEVEIITKYNKKRRVYRFTWTDRLIQRLIYQILNPPLEAQFSKFSFAFQAGKGTGQAVLYAASLIQQGGEFVAEIDLQDYYNNIDKDLLENCLTHLIPDAGLFSLIRQYIYCATDAKQNRGILQGSSLSCIFANLYLHTFDEWLEQSGISFCRYCDDINLYAQTRAQADCLLQEAKDLLENTYKLKINNKKTRVFPSVNRFWLGFEFYKTNDQAVRFRKFKKQGVYTNWNTSAIQKVDQHYHLISNGILSRQDYTILFENETGKRFLPIESLEAINVYSNTVFSPGFFSFANQKGLKVSLFDQHAHCIGRFYGEASRRDASTLLKQASIYNNEQERLRYAKALLIAAVSNIRENLRYYGYKYSNNAKLSHCASELTEHIRIINQCRSIQDLMLAEARARNKYYTCFDDIILRKDFVFENRTRRPPKNAVNAMISFGNTILYNHIATEIHKTSLNIQIGILHATGRRNESLHLDLAELFKPLVVDRLIFTLINKRMIQLTDHFETESGDAVLLNAAGKRLFLLAFEKKLYSKLEYHGEQASYRTIIQREIQHLLQAIRQNTRYKPYRA